MESSCALSHRRRAHDMHSQQDTGVASWSQSWIRDARRCGPASTFIPPCGLAARSRPPSHSHSEPAPHERSTRTAPPRTTLYRSHMSVLRKKVGSGSPGRRMPEEPRGSHGHTVEHVLRRDHTVVSSARGGVAGARRARRARPAVGGEGRTASVKVTASFGKFVLGEQSGRVVRTSDSSRAAGGRGQGLQELLARGGLGHAGLHRLSAGAPAARAPAHAAAWRRL